VKKIHYITVSKYLAGKKKRPYKRNLQGTLTKEDKWLFQLDDSKSLHGKCLFHQTSREHQIPLPNDHILGIIMVYQYISQSWATQTSVSSGSKMFSLSGVGGNRFFLGRHTHF